MHFKDFFEHKLHRYTGKDIDITFIKERCTHVASCLRGEPKVFFEVRKPWIMPDLGQVDKIAEVVETCPTGALHYTRNDGKQNEIIPEQNTIQSMAFGPLNVRGHISIKDSSGMIRFEDTRLALCRCGKSKIPPLCDGRHHQSGFRERGKIRPRAPYSPETVLPRSPLVITIHDKGPYKIEGPFTLIDGDGIKKEQASHGLLCSCGKSKNMPYCDGSHSKQSSFKTFLKKLFG